MGASGFVALLASRLPPSRRDEVAAIAGLEDLLAAHDAAARGAWPTIAVTRERYTSHLAQLVVAREGESAEQVLRTVPAADVYLAAACCDGTPAAIAAVRDSLVPSMRQALGKLAMPTPTIDEAVQRVMTMLFVGDGGPPQIAGYAGRGTLRAWMRTIAVRTARRLRGVEHDDAPGDAELEALPGAMLDPELALLRDRYRDDVRRAFAEAFAGVTERQRNVLRQYHIDGLTIDKLGTLYRVNRATAARWVAAARQAVLDAMRAKLVERLRVSQGQVDSIVRLVRSQLDVSVREAAMPRAVPARRGRTRDRRS